jgi:iron complex outermembrane receptor protein
MFRSDFRLVTVAVISTAGAASLHSAALAAAEPPPVLEEIVVMAQKHEQSVQDVGISITAFSGDDLHKLGFNKASDIQYQTTGMLVSYASNSSVPNFVIRGVGLNDFTPLNSSPVTVSLDEVSYSYTPFLNFGLFDLERVEVLKGPQGTLYGRNTTGGAVNYYSVKPGDEFGAEVRATAGNYQHFAAEGYVNIPLSDTLASRLSFSRRVQDSGPWKNDTLGKDLGEMDNWAVRAQLAWKPTTDLHVNFNVHGGLEDSDGSQYSFLPANTADGSDLRRL